MPTLLKILKQVLHLEHENSIFQSIHNQSWTAYIVIRRQKDEDKSQIYQNSNTNWTFLNQLLYVISKLIWPTDPQLISSLSVTNITDDVAKKENFFDDTVNLGTNGFTAVIMSSICIKSKYGARDPQKMKFSFEKLWTPQGYLNGFHAQLAVSH